MSPDFLNPERLWLLLVVVALAVVYVVVLRWRRRATVRFTQLELLDKVAPRRPTWRRHVVAGLQLLGLAVAVVAVARPVERTTERTRTEGQVLLLFDVSLSMMAEDVDPDRFLAAQDAAQRFVDKVEPGVEVGLVSFSGAVAEEVAPTLDRERVRRGIEELELAESTAIGDALTIGTDIVLSSAEDDTDESTADANGRGSADTDGTDGTDGTGDDNPAAPTLGDEIAPGAMVLLSDGETTVGRPTAEGAAAAAEAGIPVFTIAFGTESGAIEDPATGQIVPVPVRTEELEAVAETTGGASFTASTSSQLADAYDEVRGSLGETLGEEIEIVRELTWQWALGAFALLALAWALSLWWLRGMV